MTASRHLMLLIAVMIGCLALTSQPARAQWWPHAPADFEDCADRAEKIAAKDARSAALSDCNAKFAGRRKPGGGYAYFDFMQNRNFDIAGPNPTADEQKQIDEQYDVYLEGQRRSSIAAAFAAKKQQVQQQASLRSEAEKQPATTGSIPKPSPRPRAATVQHARPVDCPKHSFSCDWPRLSEGINDVKKALFGSSSSLSSSKTKPKPGLSG